MWAYGVPVRMNSTRLCTTVSLVEYWSHLYHIPMVLRITSWLQRSKLNEKLGWCSPLSSPVILCIGSRPGQQGLLASTRTISNPTFDRLLFLFNARYWKSHFENHKPSLSFLPNINLYTNINSDINTLYYGSTGGWMLCDSLRYFLRRKPSSYVNERQQLTMAWNSYGMY